MRLHHRDSDSLSKLNDNDRSCAPSKSRPSSRDHEHTHTRTKSDKFLDDNIDEKLLNALDKGLINGGTFEIIRLAYKIHQAEIFGLPSWYKT